MLAILSLHSCFFRRSLWKLKKNDNGTWKISNTSVLFRIKYEIAVRNLATSLMQKSLGVQKSLSVSIISMVFRINPISSYVFRSAVSIIVVSILSIVQPEK